MSVSYNSILRESAIRVNAIVGALPAALQTTYTTVPLTSANFQSSVFPFDAFIDQETASVARFANAIADVPDHPWRAFLVSQTAPLASGDNIPDVDQNGDPIIGVYGRVLDGDDGQECTLYPVQVIRRRLLNPTAWIVPVYGFNGSGDGIVHTRTTVVVQVCVFNWDTVRAAVVANGNLLLPDSLANAITYDMVGSMIRDDEFMAQAQAYRSYADNVESQIRAMRTMVTAQSVPLPTNVAA